MRLFVDIEKSSGGFKLQFPNNEIKSYNIKDIAPGSPLLLKVLQNEPSDNFIKLENTDISFKILEKELNIVYKTFKKNRFIIKQDDNTTNYYNQLTTNNININSLNYIYVYKPEEKYIPSTDSYAILIFSKKYIKNPSSGMNKYFFKHFIDKFENKVIKHLSDKEEYVFCCAPSHLKSNFNFNTMSLLIEEIIRRNPENQFIDGKDVLLRKYNMMKSSSNLYRRTIKNQYNSIFVSTPDLIKNKTVLLIDDIYTSGSTMLACKKLLLESGAKHVIMFAFAKTREFIGDQNE